MFEIIKTKYNTIKKREELNKLSLDIQIEEAKRKDEFDKIDLAFSIKQREKAIELLDSTESVNNQVQDTDLASGWFIHGSKSGQMTNELHKAFLANAYVLYQTNPHARSIVRGLVKFVLGVGPSIVPKDKKNKKDAIEAWREFKKVNKFNVREKEIATRLFRDGEVFNRIFRDSDEGNIRLRFIRSNLIGCPTSGKKYNDDTASFGIITDPDDIETPITYIKIDDQGNFKEEIDATDIKHLKINCDADDKRGVTIFRVVAKRLKQYEDWLEDRIVLNKIRSAIALVKEVETGNVGAVKNIRDANLSSRFASDKNVAQTFERGTVITASKGIKYNLLSPNINATDVKDDGRAILLDIASGIGFPEMILTSDFSNSNYSSSLVAQNPFVREIEDWQDFLVPFYQELFEEVIKAKIEAGKLPSDTSTECDVEFPPMISADMDKLSKAFETLYRFRIVSKKTWRMKMGLDHDLEKTTIDEEDTEDGGINPNQIPPGAFNPKNMNPAIDGSKAPSQQQGGQKKFNMPITPVNQYGAAFIEAMNNKDYKKAEEIADKILALDEIINETTEK